MTPAAPAQLRALLRLRWQMVRAPGLRLGGCVGALVVLWLLAQSLQVAPALEPALLDTAVALAPEAFLGFAVLALIAPLTAGGGNEVVPPEQLVAFPVRPATYFLGGLLLAPVNLVWLVQLLALAGLTSVLTAGGDLVAGLVTTTTYVVCVTVLGQAVAWAVAGLRQTRAGRRGVAAVGAGLLVAGVLVVREHAAGAVLDASPTRWVSAAVAEGGAGDLGPWAATTAALVALTGVALAVGGWACGWALRRPGDAGVHREGTPRRRRQARPSALRELVAVDRASVWRAPALRRGGLVLGLLPGLLAASVELTWQALPVLPGLVAAGAGLLFGINVFCLDGSGALWLASLPHDPALAMRSKLRVSTETVLCVVALAALTGSVRSPGSPSTTELVALVAAGLACTAVVVSTALALSLRRPHRADLRGPRDAVAPPGALAVASVRLAVPTALTGLLVSSGSASGLWWAPVLLAAVPVGLAALSLRRSAHRWADPAARARVVQVVAAG